VTKFAKTQQCEHCGKLTHTLINREGDEGLRINVCYLCDEELDEVMWAEEDHDDCF
jgi:hypothetical protein